MPRSSLVVGAQTIVRVNGLRMNHVQSIDWMMDTPRRRVQVLDQFTPAELIQQAATVRGVVNIYKIRTDGGIEAFGLSAPWRILSREKYFTLTVTDRVTDVEMFRAVGCSVDGQSWRAARGHIIGNVRFEGTSWSNETEATV